MVLTPHPVHTSPAPIAMTFVKTNPALLFLSLEFSFLFAILFVVCYCSKFGSRSSAAAASVLPLFCCCCALFSLRRQRTRARARVCKRIVRIVRLGNFVSEHLAIIACFSFSWGRYKFEWLRKRSTPTATRHPRNRTRTTIKMLTAITIFTE